MAAFLCCQASLRAVLQLSDKFSRTQRSSGVCAMTDCRQLRLLLSPLQDRYARCFQTNDVAMVRCLVTHWLWSRLNEPLRWTTATMRHQPPVPPAPGSAPYNATLPTGVADPADRKTRRPSLPEVAAGAMPSIPIGGIPAVCMLQGLRQSICLVGNHNEMDMIGHQAIAEQGHLAALDVLP